PWLGALPGAEHSNVLTAPRPPVPIVPLDPPALEANPPNPPATIPESAEPDVFDESVTEPEHPTMPIAANSVVLQDPIEMRSDMPHGTARSRPPRVNTNRPEIGYETGSERCAKPAGGTPFVAITSVRIARA